MIETYNITVDETCYEVDVLVDLEPGDPWRYEVIEGLRLIATGPYFRYVVEINLDHFLVGQPIHLAIEAEHQHQCEQAIEDKAKNRAEDREYWEGCKGV